MGRESKAEDVHVMIPTPADQRKPSDLKLWACFGAAVESGLRRVNRILASSGYIGPHFEWPELTWRKNGLPSITEKFDAPKDYSGALRTSLSPGTPETEAQFENEPAFVALCEYVRKHPRLSHHLGTPDPDQLIDSALKTLIGDTLDRYVHQHKTTDLILQKLEPIYIEIETYLLQTDLPIVLLVPILFLRFEDDLIDIDDRTSIIRMGDGLHLARPPQLRFNYGNHPIVQSAATHAFVRMGYTIPNEARVWNWHLLGAPNAYPIDLIERFFAALRIAAPHPTGYGQLLAMPVGWASGYTGDLVPLYKTSVRNYPPWFENRNWDEPVPTISTQQAKEVSALFTRLSDCEKTKQMSIAIRRLNSSAMRMTHEDELLDVMIALEALLSDSSQEMTHKIAIRTAALYKLHGSLDAVDVLREVKDIYGFRSKIVHGNEVDPDQKVRGKRGVRVTEAATEHLRTVLKMLLEHPRFLDVAEIDSELLLGSHAKDQIG
jgi:hypothetical protein